MMFARGKGLLEGSILAGPPYFFPDSVSDLHACVSINETRCGVSIDRQTRRVQLLWAHSEFPFRKLIGIFADISSLMRANVRRDEVPASVLDGVGMYLLISKRESNVSVL